MTKEEIKNFLLEHKANASLISMPAVMERIYACFEIDSAFNLITGNFYEMNTNLSETINIDYEGNITLKDGSNTRVFKSMPNGQAIYINNDETGYSIDEQGEYIIDESGMDISYSNRLDHNANRREDATVDVDGLSIPDNGTPILNLYDLINSKGDKTWKDNMNYLTNEYPSTRKWFDNKGKQLRKTIETDKQSKPYKNQNGDSEINELRARYDRLKKENEDLRRNTVPKKEYDQLKTEKRRSEIERNILKSQNDEQKVTTEQLKKQTKEQETVIMNLQNENEQKKQEVESLKVRNQNLQRMLKTTLDFCESVRNSFLGRVFFGSKLKQLPSGTQEQSLNNKEEQVR